MQQETSTCDKNDKLPVYYHRECFVDYYAKQNKTIAGTMTDGFPPLIAARPASP